MTQENKGAYAHGTLPGMAELFKKLNPVEKVTSIRPEVQWFAGIMEETLRNNDHKGGWGADKCSMNYLLERLEEEVSE